MSKDTPCVGYDASWDDTAVMGMGLYWDDVKIGQRFRTLGKTITEADLTMFVGVTGMVEEMFTNVDYINNDLFEWVQFQRISTLV